LRLEERFASLGVIEFIHLLFFSISNKVMEFNEKLLFNFRLLLLEFLISLLEGSLFNGFTVVVGNSRSESAFLIANEFKNCKEESYYALDLTSC
jgi:hypothetical protein